MEKIFWKNFLSEAIGLAASIACPPAVELIKVLQFGEKHLTLLVNQKEKSTVETDAWKTLLKTLSNALDHIWTTCDLPSSARTNVMSWKHLQLDTQDLQTNMAEEYELFNISGRSFIYDILCQIVNGLSRGIMKIEKRQALALARKIVQTWKKELQEIIEKGENNQYTERLRHGSKEQLMHEFDWADYKFYLRCLPYEEIEVDDIQIQGIQAIYVPLSVKEVKEHGKENKEEVLLFHDVVLRNLHFDRKSQPIGIWGEAGMGKSSFCKMFVAHLCETQLDIYPILIRLGILHRRMNVMKIPWAKAIYDAPHFENKNLRLNNIDKDIERNRKFVVLMDGLDELNSIEEQREELFTVINWFSETETFNAIITSRTLGFLQEGVREERISPIFHIQPMSMIQQNELIRLFAVRNIIPQQNIDYFKQWIKDIDNNNLKQPKIAEQPWQLLLYATIFVMDAQSHRPSNPSEVYQKIINIALNREYDYRLTCKRDEENESNRKLAEELLSEIALFIYQQGKDYAELSEIKSRLGKIFDWVANLDEAIDDLPKVFIFHDAKHENKQVIEISRKYFTDYLAAQAILRRLDKISIKYDENKNDKDSEFINAFIDLFGQKGLADNLIPYLFDLLSAKKELSEKLLPLVLFFWNGVLDMTWLEFTPLRFEMNSGYASLQLLSLIAKLCPQKEIIVKLSKFDANFPEGSSSGNVKILDKGFRDILSRFYMVSYFDKFIVSNVQTILDYSDLSYFSFRNAEIYNASLVSSNFRCANIFWVRFEKVFLESADFIEVRLWNVVFSKAIFKNVRFNNASLMQTIFEDATLEDMDFSDATLENVGFDSAMLRNINFNHVCFDKVSFKDTRFENIQFGDKQQEGWRLFSHDEAIEYIKIHFPNVTF